MDATDFFGILASVMGVAMSLAPLYLNHYNYRRPHGSLGHQPPAARLTDLPRNYT